MVDAWLPDSPNHMITTVTPNLQYNKVSDLIGNEQRGWKADIITNTFTVEDAQRILSIPLAKEAHDDFLAWGVEGLGDYSVRSAYKLLQTQDLDPNAYDVQNATRDFFHTLRNLNLPKKILVTIWRCAWNYLPTYANLKCRKLLQETTCPRCGLIDETIDHLLRHCSVSMEVWSELNLSYTSNCHSLNFTR